MKNKSLQLSAVALSFNPKINKAPEVIAKGEGIIAEKILEIARLHEKEIIIDPELMALLKSIPEGKEIPEALYNTIAIIYSYLYKINSESRRM